MSQAAVLEEKTWRQQGLELIERVASEGRPFDAYTLSQRGLPAPPHHNQWGALFTSAKAKGLIELHDYHRSERPNRARGLCALWKKKP
ncbi:hypothetical protein [Arthrobacter burdickii]|uniref:Uncharacterized protein n=1 Tax=Arthrobacter burdickii TaxID=3035920 RepID=A0ABT8K4F1_9MICC|nr:hypothetical protein [Arthrobacter burdickii]MDN4611917.1 hypothetical protein [Arthrobacter burdickii]